MLDTQLDVWLNSFQIAVLQIKKEKTILAVPIAMRRQATIC